ncbi:cadmium/zinc-transporting ATPase HMA3-like [Nicotiana tabacum]|uniref:Cadmium/zinc-transporting ATPase HMA3-like n=1 Tax=Nicotiana tabacum TaxID=4097 RepID=T2K0N9_TOBAC|nr:cadmium/zinc-transporting ATPase HMA3-like [Nicotiana tabacum]CCQ77797.1 heavy metal ATPase [Nicotiana tabacum]CCQ77798.1 heavy metal ATPase [Nicotiana tabacum]
MVESEKMNETKKLSKSYFDVLGICCTSEVVLVEKILKNLEGVKEVSVIVTTKTVIVIHDSLLISPQQIVKALNQARLEASIRVKGEKNYQKKWPSPFAIGSGILLGLSFLKYFFAPFQWLALAAVAVGIPPIIFRGVAAVRNLTLDINILVLIAVAGSIVLHDYWEAGTIVFLFAIAEWLESRASHKATAAMSSLVNIVPPTAVLAESGEVVNVDEVKVNSILAVKAGETIPIDGVVVEGECDVDEKTLTGESFPVSKQRDSTVWAGTTNLNGYISVKTTALAEDCAVARMAQLVEDAQNKKSKTQRYIDKCAKYYTPAIVAISASLAIVPTALRVHNRNEWYRLALVTLVSACPCALVLSTPVAMCCALSKAATSGLLFKGAEYLETLAKIKIMAFDKTGTITKGEFMVTEFKSLIDGFSLNTLLYWVSSIESKSGHPMAAALVDYAQSNSVEPKPDRVEQFQNFPGEGIFGRIDGMEIYVGNRKISSRAGCTTVPEIEGDSFKGKSVGYIFLGSSPAGIFSLSDVCRIGVKEAMRELKQMGIKTAMLTGDCYAAANHVQDQLGGALDEFQAELLPEDKATIIKGFQKEAPTAMIGDGLNDAPALATADIGISMGISGSALAKETGHVILMTNDIGRIPKAARLARRVRRKIVENMIISVVTKAAIVALAIAGYPLVWAAVLADTGTCLLVILNSMLLLRGGTRRHGKKCWRSSTPSHAPHHKDKASCCKSENAPQLCCSDIESQKKCTSQSCSSEVCVPRCQPVSSGSKSCGNNQCPDSIENSGFHSHRRPQCCSSKMAAKACQSAVSESKSCGNNQCPDSVENSGFHSHPRPECCSSKMAAKACQSAVSESKSCGNNQCPDSVENSGFHSHPRPQCCSSKMAAKAGQSALSESKSCGNNNCSDSIHKSNCHSLTNSLVCSSKMSAPQCHSATSSNKSCGSTKCSDFSDKKCCQSDKIPQTCSTKKSAPGCQSAVSGSKSCGNSKCSDSKDNSSHPSHPDHQTCMSKLCAPQSQSATSSSRTCGNTKCSDTNSKNSCYSQTNSESCSSKMSGPSCKTANSGSRSCRNKKCQDSATENSFHSPLTNPLSGEKLSEQKSLDLVRKDKESSHDLRHGCSDEEHDHTNLDKAYDSCALQECCYSVQGNKTDVSETGIQETAHCDSTNQTCQTASSGSMTCGNDKILDSLSIHGCHSHDNPLHEENNLEQKILDVVGEGIKSPHAVGHGCSDKEHDHSHPEKAYDSCATDDCCFSVQVHGIDDVSKSEIQETAHCDSTKQSMVISSSCKHEPKDQVNHCGLHSKTTPTDEELAKLVRRCCKYKPCHDVRSGCRKHAAECGPTVRSTINILRDNHHHYLDCSGRKVCSLLEKRHIGGCCDSFRKECCAKKKHLGASFGGGLSEIVIE